MNIQHLPVSRTAPPSLWIIILLICSMLTASPTAAAAQVAEHQTISAWQGTATCIACHETEAQEVFHSVHYQWLGQTPYLIDGPDLQGKFDMGVNSYCINIRGNWTGCSSCHVGLGALPATAINTAQLDNIDCLICHQERYKRIKIDGLFVPDTDSMDITILEAARTVHLPNRATCLQCHAKGGGGDNYKRGDLALAHASTADSSFDIHMSTTGANISCQQCHITESHLMAGRGSDLRPTDLDREMPCSGCHEGKDTATGHDTPAVNKHVARVACQTCHIPTYARNASDTIATEQTEVHRDWREPHETASGVIHPTSVMAGDLAPSYRWWNGWSSTYLLFDDAEIDPQTGKIPTSRPIGNISGSNSKIFPFKYKTATQPLAVNHNQLIALDTSIYFSTGDPVTAIESGLENMGYPSDEPFSWADTDTFQLITHEVAPAARALSCADCHESNDRIDLISELGYHLKKSRGELCVECHEIKDGEDKPEYLWIHQEHVRDERYDCSWCHTFSRPERNLVLHPLFQSLSYAIDVLRILTGLPAATTVQDQNGNGKIGIEDAIHLSNDVSEQ